MMGQQTSHRARFGALLNSGVSAMHMYTRAAGETIAWVAGWAWALLAGLGGLILLIHRGPLPITNGWFAMLSGLAACPLTAVILGKYARVLVPGYVQLAAALLIMVAGRIAVVVVLHRPFLPHCSINCW